jgi:hypothetical protein
MAKVERGIVKPPNQEFQNLATTRSQAPRAEMPALPPPTPVLLGGSADLTRQPSPVAPTSFRFNVDDARMPQPPSAFEPGKGDVPVDPSDACGSAIIRAFPFTDDAKQH